VYFVAFIMIDTLRRFRLIAQKYEVHMKFGQLREKSKKLIQGFVKVRKLWIWQKILHKYKELERSERVIKMQGLMSRDWYL